MKFGEKLKIIIKQKYGNIKKFCEAVGYSQQHISQYLNNRRTPGLDFLIKLGEMGFDMNMLLGGEKMEIKPEKVYVTRTMREEFANVMRESYKATKGNKKYNEKKAKYLFDLILENTPVNIYQILKNLILEYEDTKRRLNNANAKDN